MEQQLADAEHQEKSELLQLLDASNCQHDSLDQQVPPICDSVTVTDCILHLEGFNWFCD